MRLKAIVDEGEMMPALFGLAYRRFDLRDRVCYVWPLNWVVRHARNLWFVLRISTSHNYRERFELKAYARGRRELSEKLNMRLLAHGPDAMANQLIAEIHYYAEHEVDG